MSSGAVPAFGTFSNIGLNKRENENSKPHTIVLKPVLAPALIPAPLIVIIT